MVVTKSGIRFFPGHSGRDIRAKVHSLSPMIVDASGPGRSRRRRAPAVEHVRFDLACELAQYLANPMRDIYV